MKHKTAHKTPSPAKTQANMTQQIRIPDDTAFKSSSAKTLINKLLAIDTITAYKTPSPTKTRQTFRNVVVTAQINKTPNTKANPTSTTIKYANHPDYEYNTLKNRWVRKSDLRPAELVNRYKEFLREYLTTHTNLDQKKINTLVRKHATSSDRLKEILLSEGEMTEKEAKKFFRKNNFWHKELCHHMKKICPAETDLLGRDWCKFHENVFFYVKDGNNKPSCYCIDDIYDILSSSFTGGNEDHTIFLQPPRDPYTRKPFTEKFIKTILKQLRHQKEFLNEIHIPHVVYFFRNYKKFYNNPHIKKYLNKNILTNDEKWELSEAIEDFLTETDEIHHGWAKGPKRYWFWTHKDTEPTDLYEYIYNIT